MHGAQVTSWRNEQGEELLFTSTKVRLVVFVGIFELNANSTLISCRS